LLIANILVKLIKSYMYSEILKMTREQELEQRYQDFQEWLNLCPLVVTDYQDFTDQFQITFSLNAD